ncbi:hypothetical protein An08g07690 [Aspergillus niger]|uniref:Uncharacterized protein n=2 Tax=Aspergillus niger TaxID=5061 RepID=A2QRZ0_ASPNC|nr:hypothetical protein An08g07690 [Aspergillus niger]CAL00787.1 hypothetical protein An08g07690 [Aspergillus niger]
MSRSPSYWPVLVPIPVPVPVPLFLFLLLLLPNWAGQDERTLQFLGGNSFPANREEEVVYSKRRITNDDGQLKKQKVIQSFSPSSSLWWEPIQVGTPHPLFLPEH